jgi:hypothetical protein
MVFMNENTSCLLHESLQQADFQDYGEVFNMKALWRSYRQEKNATAIFLLFLWVRLLQVIP